MHQHNRQAYYDGQQLGVVTISQPHNAPSCPSAVHQLSDPVSNCPNVPGLSICISAATNIDAVCVQITDQAAGCAHNKGRLPRCLLPTLHLYTPATVCLRKLASPVAGPCCLHKYDSTTWQPTVRGMSTGYLCQTCVWRLTAEQGPGTTADRRNCQLLSRRLMPLTLPNDMTRAACLGRK
jgi:hypothetical protein